MRKKDFATVVGCGLLFLGVVAYLVVEGDWHSVIVGAFITGGLIPWTLSAKRITGKPIHHPVNLLVMGIITAIATFLASILAEQITIRSSGGGEIGRYRSVICPAIGSPGELHHWDS